MCLVYHRESFTSAVGAGRRCRDSIAVAYQYLWLVVSDHVSIQKVVVCIWHRGHLREEGTHIWLYVQHCCPSAHFYLWVLSSCVYGMREDIVYGFMSGGFVCLPMCRCEVCMHVRTVTVCCVPYYLETHNHQLNPPGGLWEGPHDPP